MTYYPRLLNEVKTNGYYAAVSTKEIRAEYDRLLALRESDLLEPTIYEYRCVRALIEVKLAVTYLIEKGMRAEDVVTLARAIDLAKNTYHSAMVSLDPDAPPADDRFDAVIQAVQSVFITMQGITADFDSLISEGKFKGTISDFSRLVEKYRDIKVESVGDHFPEIKKGKFRFVSVKKAVFDLLKNKLDELMRAMFVGFSASGDFILDTVSQYDRLQSVPSLSLAQGIKDSPVLFVCTPIREEFDIMLNANLHQNGIERILQIDLLKVPKNLLTSRDALSRYLLFLKKERDPNVIAFYGAEGLPAEDRRNLYAAISDYFGFVAKDIRLVFWDKTGDMQGLTEYGRFKGELSLVPAENRYLRLPSYADACEMVPSFDEEKKEELRERCVFMGYLGLNYFNCDKEELGLAFDTTKRISEQNAAKVLSFLAHLPDDAKLVPLDWHYDPAIQKAVHPTGGDYDYDEIREVSDERIRAIIANESLTIYEKCGELVRYILLTDEDKSVWKEVLSDEEKEARIARATRIIAYTMRVFHKDPKVTIVHSSEGAWGGLCCNGGAEIRYKKSDSEDIAWLMDAILHELYHSLQHTLTDTSVDPTWYKKTYHISNERIASWNDNNGVYISIGEGQDGLYMVQTLEVDARDFAGLCLGDQVYHDHDRRKNKRG